MDEIQLYRETSSKDVIERYIKLPKFKEWLENTQLFNVIKEESNSHGMMGISPTIVGKGIQLQLEPGVVVNRMEDLPLEMVMEFFRNSPFYANSDNNFKILEP